LAGATTHTTPSTQILTSMYVTYRSGGVGCRTVIKCTRLGGSEICGATTLESAGDNFTISGGLLPLNINTATILYFTETGTPALYFDIDLNITNISDWISEPGNITVTKANAYFWPYKIEFDAAVPDNFYSLFTANPYGVIQFTYEGYSYKGFIIKAKISPANASRVTFELLSTKTNTIANLIR